MDAKLLARIGAAVFVGLASAVTLMQLHEEPTRRVQGDRIVRVPEGDPLPARLRACGELGERALSSTDCREAWAEKRRRFFGVDHPDAYAGLAGDASSPAAHIPAMQSMGED